MFPKSALEAVKGLDLTGKVFLVTGAYSGLGAASTKALLSANARVILAGRNAETQAKFVDDLCKSSSIDPSLMDSSATVELGDLASVRDFALHVRSKYDTIDCLMNNAGIMNTPYEVTKDGFEIQFGTNVIGHFLLAKLLADRTKRQVWLSSRGHAIHNTSPPPKFDNEQAPPIDLDMITNVDKDSYDGWRRYQQSKLGDLLLAKQFAVEYKDTNMEAVSISPGLVATNLFRSMPLLLTQAFLLIGKLTGGGAATPDEGARTQVLCATMSSNEIVNGAYYHDCQVTEPATVAKDMEQAKKLYDYCDEVTKEFQQV